jgi:hypothetical protein
MDDQPRRAADDTARDMERRLKDLDTEVHDAEKAQRAMNRDPGLTRVAGDATEVREGEHSAGATMRGADAEHHAHSHRPRETPHEEALSRDELDTEQALAEEGDAMEARLEDLDDEIGEAERAADRAD